MIEIIKEILILIACFFLAGHDSTSYLLRKGGNNAGTLLYSRLDRWHRDGLINYCIVVLAINVGEICYALKIGQSFSLSMIDWKMFIAAAFIRASFFDLAFNYWSQNPINLIGTTAFFDRLSARIFGQKGAVKKSLAFLILLVALNYLQYKFGK
jgi:hypothetical protein